MTVLKQGRRGKLWSVSERLNAAGFREFPKPEEVGGFSKTWRLVENAQGIVVGILVYDEENTPWVRKGEVFRPEDVDLNEHDEADEGCDELPPEAWSFLGGEPPPSGA